MITLATLCIIYTILMWFKRFKDSQKGLYKLNIFDEAPNILTATLLITTIVSILILLYLIIEYLP